MVHSSNLDEMFNTLRTTEPYLPDDGFTSGVMARLPEAKELPLWIKNIIMLVFTTIGSAIAASQIPLVEKLPMMDLFSFTTMPLLSLPVLGTVLGAAAVCTFLASYFVIWLAQNDRV